ncbi:hypothetical protein NA57DRAFT_53037 [Rhizodiscina lignyota]|uniref:Uncharacterized protein n=1 Tax=Rhizodiscina lignyota TaxID=1504668 RepID=A0A9P4IP71_9PEZI|nr:hypothetical protein NA57DRAFT_53037 [Rhizodiscina lignyota]
MPKRKRGSRRPAKEPFLWSPEEMAHVLAWYDLKAKYRIGREIFRESIVSYLKGRWPRDFTWEKVDNLIKKIHDKCYRNDKAKFRHRGMMLEVGTECLDRKWFESEFKEDEPYLDAFARKDMLIGDPHFQQTFDRKTRSRSISAAAPLETRATRSRSKNVAVDIISNPREQSGGEAKYRGRERTERSVSRSSSSPTSAKSILSEHHSRPTAETRQVSVGQSEMVIDSEESAEELRTQRRYSTIQRQSWQYTVRTEQPGPTRRTLVEELQEKLLAAEATIRTLNDENYSLQSECAKLRNQLAFNEEEQRNRKDCWDSVQRDRDLKKDLSDRKLKVLSLEREISETRNLARFVKPFEISTGQSVTNRITQGLGDIAYNTIRKAFDQHTDPIQDAANRIEQNSELDALFKRSIGNTTDADASVTHISEILNGASAQHIIGAAIAAALCEWVFNSDWPNFDRGQSQLLEGYRKCLKLQEEGKKALQTLDRAAHDRLMSEPAFTGYTRPNKANELANRLLIALSALLGTSVQIADEDRELVREIFHEALEVKCRMLTVKPEMHLRTVKVGAPFDPHIMDPVEDGWSPVNRSHHRSGRVKMSLFPGLCYATPNAKAQEEAPTDVDGMVRLKMRVVDDSSGDFEKISNAVVLLEE